MTVPKEDSAEARQLLLAREARGLRVPLLARMLFVIYGIGIVSVQLILSDEPRPRQTLNLLVFAMLGGALVGNMRLWLKLQRGREVERVGWVGAVLDALFVLALSSLAQMAAAEAGHPVSAVFKTELPIVLLTIVVINGPLCCVLMEGTPDSAQRK